MSSILWTYNPLSIDYLRFLRVLYLRWQASRLPTPHPYSITTQHHGAVSISDLDEMGHMNNMRYARECELARIHFLLATHMWWGVVAARKQGKKVALPVGSTVQRFRKELKLGARYTTTCKVVCWHKHSIIMEQTLISSGVVNYVLLVENVVYGLSADDLMRFVTSDASPPVPRYVEKWLASMHEQKKAIPRTAEEVNQYLGHIDTKPSQQLSKL